MCVGLKTPISLMKYTGTGR